MSSSAEAIDNPVLRRMVHDLTASLGDLLHGIVLYGSAARGDWQKGTSDFNLIVVLENLEPGTLEKMTPILKHWSGKGQPAPRIFSKAVIAESADVFPIEFLDIQSRRDVLHGRDPFASLTIHLDHLRLQCEREMREKMMRLREGYIEAHTNSRSLTRLLTDSYTTFVALFRGCLHLLGGDVPVHNREVVAAFCARADIDPAPFTEVDRLKLGERSSTEPKATFARYYEALTRAVHAINRFEPHQGGKTQ